MKKKSVKELVGLAIILSIVIVLQTIGSFIKIGSFSISLVLVPIVIGAILYGPKAGAILGLTFSLVVVYQCASGVDAGGAILFNANAFLTVLLCVLKGTLCGFGAGLIYQKLKIKNDLIRTLIASISAPIINTGIFVIGLYICFFDILKAWAGGSNTVYYVITGLVGLNFVIETAFNGFLSPAILRIIKIANIDNEDEE